MGWEEPSQYPSPYPRSTPAAGRGGLGGSLVCSPDLLGVRWRWGYIHRVVLAGAAGASLAVL